MHLDGLRVPHPVAGANTGPHPSVTKHSAPPHHHPPVGETRSATTRSAREEHVGPVHHGGL